MYLFNPENNTFNPYSLREQYEQYGNWPSSGVDVTEDIFTKYTQTPPEGKCLGHDEDGGPCWVDVPPLSYEQVVSQAEQQKSMLLAEASAFIAPLADALAGGYIDDDDAPRLTAWQKYRYALTKVDPAKPIWPEKPE
ncbi:tail fiber assembly protein [Citrobacter freundii]|uniref:tail fiber assembly protein n=1 Tax=Citrobacter freundii TaxID=546 RepID=UPI000BCC842D|nr:tail fiber assembly protein [Citrobacter freundii]PCQ43990.1 phage tail protein [Citrobacter freundii]